jgi:acetyltransferase-like isoleucine patch superfamily enzyme
VPRSKPERSSIIRLLGTVLDEGGGLYRRYVLHRGDYVSYLRSLGVEIGVDCEIMTRPANFGSEPWLVEIGSRVTISTDVLLLTHDGSSRLYREKYSDSPWGNRFAPIRIFDNCFVGARTIILPGVTVGPDSIIGAGSVVTKTVPPDTVWAGAPARELSTVPDAEARYAEHMVPIAARDRDELRRELTRRFFGRER